MNNAIRKSAAALAAAALLAVSPAYSTGIPTFDGAAALNAVQQLLNWQARFQSLIRNGLTQIPGVKQFLDAQQKGQIETMFQRRQEQCTRLSKNNSTSANLCINTVRLERQKYQLLEHMNTEITAEFNRINGMISKQGSLASSAGSVSSLAGAGGSAGKAESAEQDVQAQLQALVSKIKYYEGQLAQIDQTITQLKWARKQLTKDQLSGNTGLSAAVSKGVTVGVLEQKALKWRKDAASHRSNSVGISNRF